ncbi:MAG: hypothetical protein BWK76_00855 [Desulfobulbaceae bacterium A2]|nr:MAG: hypothetical protein BWK76_00855 [Desulfobulbaceae bacterium A2]
MDRDKVRELLLRLREVILSEREHAKKLELDKMAEDTALKEAMLQTLSTVSVMDPVNRPIADEVRRENRRNAFLFKATLKWIQETMEFFGRRTVPATYGHAGCIMAAPINGRLLSGKI